MYLSACNDSFQREDEIGNYVNQEVELFSPLDLLSVARQITLGMVSLQFLTPLDLLSVARQITLGMVSFHFFSPLDLLSVARQITLDMVSSHFCLVCN